MQIYPLIVKFDYTFLYKLTVKNAQGSLVMQAARSLTLKTKFEVCAYQKYGQQNYTIAAPKLLQWRTHYDFWNQQGELIGNIHGLKGKSDYHIDAGDRQTFVIKMVYSSYVMLWIIPAAILLMGALCMNNSLPNIATFGYCLLILAILTTIAMSASGIFDRTYVVQRSDGHPVMRFARLPPLEMRPDCFAIKAIDALSETEEPAVLLGVISLIIGEEAARTAD
jgi:hypothetical protein